MVVRVMYLNYVNHHNYIVTVPYFVTVRFDPNMVILICNDRICCDVFEIGM